MDNMGYWIGLPGGLQYREPGMDDLHKAKAVLAQSGISLRDVAYDHSLQPQATYYDPEGVNFDRLEELISIGLEKTKRLLSGFKSDYRIVSAPAATLPDSQPALDMRLALLMR